MKHKLFAALFGIVFVGSAHAWPKCPDGSISLQNEAGKYVCPTPAPAPTPAAPPVTVENKPVVNVDADAAAKAEAEAKANSSSASLGIGGGATLKGKVEGTVKGTNTGTFTNDGTQATSVGVDARSGSVTDNSKTHIAVEGSKTKVGPVSSVSTSGVKASGNSDVKVNTSGGKVEDVGNGNGSGNTLTSGDSKAVATGNGAGNSTNITTLSSTVDKRIEVPVLFNPLPTTVTTAGNLVTERLACGPLQQVVKTPVLGTQVGIFVNTSIDLGNDFELASVFDKDGNQVYYTEKEFVEDGAKVVRRFGTQAIVVTALPNVSGASTISIGFAGSHGGANGGAGASSAMSRIVTKVTLSSCELPGAFKVVKSTEKTVVGLTREDLLSALQQARAELSVSVPIPERRWVACPKDGCKAPKDGFYVYPGRSASADSSVDLLQKNKAQTK